MAEQHPPKDIVPGCGEWKDNDWPPLLGPWRYGHEAVVVPAPSSSSLDSKEPVVAAVVVVLGGEHEDEQVFDSVQWLPLVVGGGATTTITTTLKPQSSWQTGPSLNTPRSQHASVLCNGAIYAMGGFNGWSPLNSIERISVPDIWASTSSNTRQKTTNTTRGWTTLSCRLQMGRIGCTAAVVQNRYIVVGGGQYGTILSSVEILDTRGRNNTITMVPGPSLCVPRSNGAMTVCAGSNNRVYMTGGEDEETGALSSIEYLEFYTTPSSSSSAQVTFSSSWKVDTTLALPGGPRYYHAAVNVVTANNSNNKQTDTATAPPSSSSVLVVAGGSNGWGSSETSVPVLVQDPTSSNGNGVLVWKNLPPTTRSMGHHGGALVAVQHPMDPQQVVLAVLGGLNQSSCETLQWRVSVKDGNDDKETTATTQSTTTTTK